MQPKSGSGNQLEPDPRAIPPTNAYLEPWWRGVGYNPAVARGNASNSSSLEGTNCGSESDGGQLQSEEDDDVTKDSQSHQSVSAGNHGQEQHMQHVASAVPAMGDEGLTQPPQLELVSHSIACASNPYQDPYYGGMVAAYGHQPVGYPPFVGMPQARMPLPLEITQEPVYVNAKQYQGILRRRQARAKAELEKKLIKARKPYLHESRHQHAMRRARGTGGRFAKKTDNASNNRGEGTPCPALSSQSATSSGSEPLHSDSAETWNSSLSQQAHKYQNGSSGSTYRSRPGTERGEDGGDRSGQQWGSISQRPLAIQ